MTIWFDMDGTIADLYAVNGWLEMLNNYDATPYKMAKPMLNLSQLARLLNSIQKKGYEIGIVSWTSKNSNNDYNNRISIEKLRWLHKHLSSVEWNKIHIVEYGTPKHEICEEGILFDDELRNRSNWNCGLAYEPNQIIEVLKKLLK